MSRLEVADFHMNSAWFSICKIWMCVALVGNFKLCSCLRFERLWLELEKFKIDARATIPFGALSFRWIQFSMQQTETTQLFADCRGMHTCPSTNQQNNRLTGLCARIRHCIAFAQFSLLLILFSTRTHTYYPANFSTALRNDSIFPRTAVAIGFTKAHALFLRYYTLSVLAR